MEAVHLINQFNKSRSSATALTIVLPRRLAHSAPSPALARPPPWQGLRFGCLRYGT
jgi:hypothetical protein